MLLGVRRCLAREEEGLLRTGRGPWKRCREGLSAKNTAGAMGRKPLTSLPGRKRTALVTWGRAGTEFHSRKNQAQRKDKFWKLKKVFGPGHVYCIMRGIQQQKEGGRGI